MSQSLNDKAWEKLFSDYDILRQIEREGFFQISARQIKEVREPRLMAKFDHTVNLPQIFSDNNLSILPITRGDYVISHFDAYHKFESGDSAITNVSLPRFLQSLDGRNIQSETIALNAAVAAGIMADFLGEEKLVATVSGRMGSGVFDFSINNLLTGTPSNIRVNNSQIEIDAAYEGVRSLALFEAKRDLSEDFLVRQLYYPYRTWQSRITKPVRPLFLVYSNGIYRLYEYEFTNLYSYSSISLVRQKNYSIENTEISKEEIKEVLNTTQSIAESQGIPFPQADSFERVINLCELLEGQELSRSDVTERYAFDVRQTNYYTDAARYLGLAEKVTNGREPRYKLTEKGRGILSMGYKQRQLAFSRCILEHVVFAEMLRVFFVSGVIPNKQKTVQIMRQSGLKDINSDSTYVRRASTIRRWTGWIVSLITAHTGTN